MISNSQSNFSHFIVIKFKVIHIFAAIKLKSMSNWIKKGISVVSVTNLEKVMTVDHPIFQGKDFKDENGETKRISRLIGIELNVINEDGKTDKVVLHSKELVPLSVAMKGKLEAYRFINREGEYSKY